MPRTSEPKLISGNANMPLATAIAVGRVYLADYQALAPLVGGQFLGQQKYISAPMALFAVPSDRGIQDSPFTACRCATSTIKQAMPRIVSSCGTYSPNAN